MTIYHIESRLYLPITVDEAWDFLSSPANLLKITPSKVKFSMLQPKEEGFYEGQVFVYQLSPLPGFTTRWVSEISTIKPKEYFIDIQLAGPYKLWHHQHQIHPVEGGVEVRDIVHYALPMGFLGKLAQSLFIKKQLLQTFRFREDKMIGFFGSLAGHKSHLTIQPLKRNG